MEPVEPNIESAISDHLQQREQRQHHRRGKGRGIEAVISAAVTGEEIAIVLDSGMALDDGEAQVAELRRRAALEVEVVGDLVGDRLVAEVIDELGIEGQTVGIAPVGCSVFAYNYFNCDMVEAAHGRAPAVSTGLKRVQKDKVVICYQGDGDLLAIGTAESVHAANRGEHITVIFINNAIYGMTGGQMAPTTLIGQKTSTCPYGREPEIHGYPLKITEIAATLQGTCYVTRQSVESVASINKAKKAIRKAFEASMAGKGSSLVEIVSTCNSGWKLSPVKANKWMEENMFPFYPKGDLKDTI